MLGCEPFKIPQFRRSKTAALGEPDRVQPKLRPVRIPLHVNVDRLVPIRRVKEEPVRAFAMNGRHRPSVARWRRIFVWLRLLRSQQDQNTPERRSTANNKKGETEHCAFRITAVVEHPTEEHARRNSPLITVSGV